MHVSVNFYVTENFTLSPVSQAALPQTHCFSLNIYFKKQTVLVICVRDIEGWDSMAVDTGFKAVPVLFPLSKVPHDSCNL